MSFWTKSEMDKEEKIEKMSQVIPKLVSAVEANQERLDICSDVFRQEYGLWKCQKKADFKSMLTALAESHIQYYQHVSISVNLDIVLLLLQINCVAVCCILGFSLQTHGVGIKY